jgi:hypothetical protein
VEHNPEVIVVEEDEIEGIWRTNLLIEGEQERHDSTLFLCRITSIEDNLHNTSFYE